MSAFQPPYFHSLADCRCRAARSSLLNSEKHCALHPAPHASKSHISATASRPLCMCDYSFSQEKYAPNMQAARVRHSVLDSTVASPSTPQIPKILLLLLAIFAPYQSQARQLGLRYDHTDGATYRCNK